MRHEFVNSIPDQVDEGVLYISLPYATAVHKGPCGCKHEVVTPFSPTDWSMVFDGETVSLAPSIGNWSFPCRSHYWIERGRVAWAPTWSLRQIQAGRSRDIRRKATYYDVVETKAAKEPAHRGWRRLFGWFRR
ncbi:MAG: DUF6527 family protein [Pseudomonadota bacterium]|nr:DUF6527 family protein [Pseudomonadota bacterium]